MPTADARRMTALRPHAWTPERFRALRKRLRLSQTEMAERLGFSRYQTVSDIERGQQAITATAALVLDMLEEQAPAEDAGGAGAAS